MKQAKNELLACEDGQSCALIGFFFQATHLKNLYRQGWLGSGVAGEKCESVADHSFGVALLCLLLAKESFPHLDLNRVLTMAMLHDLGEIHAGDITPSEGVSADDKHRLEKAAMRRLFAAMSGGDEYLRVWEEYESQASPEASFVKQVDRLEMALQSSVYERLCGLNPESFMRTASAAIKDPELKSILDELLHARKK